MGEREGVTSGAGRTITTSPSGSGNRLVVPCYVQALFAPGIGHPGTRPPSISRSWTAAGREGRFVVAVLSAPSAVISNRYAGLDSWTAFLRPGSYVEGVPARS
jgi:hypothetical protein